MGNTRFQNEPLESPLGPAHSWSPIRPRTMIISIKHSFQIEPSSNNIVDIVAFVEE
jgi:hypothetical protein